MPQPTIVFCTTCKGRAAHIEKTLPKNLADNRDYPNAKFVIVDYTSPDHLKTYLQDNHRAALEDGRLAVYSYMHDGAFRMAHAKNLAHRLGIIEGGEVLVNLDADNFTGPGFASGIAEVFEGRSDLFLWARMIQMGADRLPRGVNGRIVVSARAYLAAGGYDEQFNTWSPDDKDFNLRLQRLGYQPMEIDRKYLDAVIHNDKMRFKEYPHARVHVAGEDQFEIVQDSEVTIANFGQFGVGRVFKNFDFERPLELDPLPTRIFGIGMHKTATTSLHAALKILGYDSEHWKSAHWAKAIWEEMTASGRSLTLEQSYALSDLPITLLYEQLDKAYPGSKFILTVRDAARWLESVRNHWSFEHNKFRGAWSTDPFTHRVHKLLYGQKTFDAEIFSARYRKHNSDVLWYFRHRPKDFLVMDMDAGAGWPQLCRFLGRPIPHGVKYPRQTVTPVL